MTPTPEGETSKERRRQYWVGIGAVIALFSLTGNAILTGQSIMTNRTNHASSVILLNRIKTLENQHGGDIANESQLLRGISGADKELNQLGLYLYESNVAACKNTEMVAQALHLPFVPCPDIQKLPPLPT